MDRRSSWLSYFSLALMMVVILTTACFADDRVALVIGNGLYQKVPALANPPQDATDIASSLQRLNFKVTLLNNASASDMRKALVEFGRKADGSDIAIVFYAGHGMEAGGENWLIPTDAELQSDTDVEAEAVSLRSVNLQVGKARQLGLIILDACRNNPFASKMKRSLGTRAVERGLIRTEPTDNVLVAYAARDGTTAQDGTGRNSPFTTALLHHVETPGLEISFLFRRVRDDVMSATKREQQPFVYGSLSKEEIYLKPAANGPIENAKKPSVSNEDEQFWRAIETSDVVGLFEEFIKRYPSSVHVDAARKKIANLSSQSPTAKTASIDPATLFSKVGEKSGPLSAADIGRLNALTHRLNLIPPDFTSIQTNGGVPDTLRRFVGVWANMNGYEGGGRTAMILVSEVDADGTVIGRYLWGPPAKKSWTKDPAGSTAFRGVITNGTLEFKYADIIMTAKIETSKRMVVAVHQGSGSRAKIARGKFEAAWQLDLGGTLSAEREKNKHPEATKKLPGRSELDVPESSRRPAGASQEAEPRSKQVACGPSGCRDVPKGCRIESGNPAKPWSVSSQYQYIVCN